MKGDGPKILVKDFFVGGEGVPFQKFLQRIKPIDSRSVEVGGRRGTNSIVRLQTKRLSCGTTGGGYPHLIVVAYSEEVGEQSSDNWPGPQCLVVTLCTQKDGGASFP